MLQAPRYDWVCYSCRAVNPAGEAWCSGCQGPAAVSGAKIKPAPPPVPVPRPALAAESEHPASALLFLLCGLYLLEGGAFAIAQKKWPVFMPPQLDGVALLSSVFGDVASAYIAGGVSGLLGVFCLAGSLFSARSQN